jgi:hypothetical protein
MALEKGAAAMGEPPHDDPLTPPRTSAPAAATTDQAVLDLDEEAAVRSRVSPHRRAAQTGIVLAVVLVVVGLLLHSLGPAPRGTASLLSSPTPTPSTVVIMSNVTFGTLTVNGHTVQGAPPLVTHLFHVGTNVVTLTAPPFEAHTCRFLFPSEQPSSSETGCEFSGYSGTFDVGGGTVAPDELVDIGLDDTDLPPDLAASAVGVVTQAVTAVPLHSVVPTGQYYATGSDAHGHIAARRAVTPVQAAVLVSLTPPSTSGFCGGQQQLCGATLFPGLALRRTSSSGWSQPA